LARKRRRAKPKPEIQLLYMFDEDNDNTTVDVWREDDPAMTAFVMDEDEFLRFEQICQTFDIPLDMHCVKEVTDLGESQRRDPATERFRREMDELRSKLRAM